VNPTWPDLKAPPPGWTVARQGASLRLFPPGSTPADSPASIVVSPLVPRTPQIPAPGTLVRQALAAEVASLGTKILQDAAPTPFETDAGAEGVRLEITVEAGGRRQRRAYVMVRDERWIYGLHLLAREDAFEPHVAAYEAAARSLAPPPG
jgi:hypothetical protein